MRRRTATRDIEAARPALAGTTGEVWRARPALASAIGALALAGPVALSVAATYGASRGVVAPARSRGLTVAWWAALSGVATVSLVVAGRLARRLLPLAALMRLSLVFPDLAPSRFRIALRTGTVDTLEERLADARSGVMDRTPLESARILLELVAHLDEHDPLTRGHSERVRAYAQSIGRELGLDRRELELLNWAALLHDVGKLEVPHEILAKSRPLKETEWEALRAHTEAGAHLAAPLRGWLGAWSGAIEEHHERWDGTGYPRGLAGEEISLAGRIVAVADVFDVMTSTRSYKRPASVPEARRELSRCAGTQFDPEVVRAFLAISVRQGRFAAPLAWLAQAAVLARLPLTQTAGGLSAGTAVVAVGAGLGAGLPTHPPRPVETPAAVVRPAARAAAEPPAFRTTGSAPARSEGEPTSKATSRTRTGHVPAAKTSVSAPKAGAPSAKPKREAAPEPRRQAPPSPSAPATPPKTKPQSPTAKPEPPPKAPPRVLPKVPRPPVLRKLPAPPKLPALPVGPPAAPPRAPELPLPTGGGSSPADGLSDVADDVVSVTDRSAPLAGEVSGAVDDVSDTADVLGLLTPPDEEAEPDDDEDGGLLGPRIDG